MEKEVAIKLCGRCFGTPCHASCPELTLRFVQLPISPSGMPKSLQVSAHCELLMRRGRVLPHNHDLGPSETC